MTQELPNGQSPLPSEVPNGQSPSVNDGSPPPSQSIPDKLIFTIVALLLVLVSLILLTNMVLQWSNYHQGIQLALKETDYPHVVILAYSRAMDFAFSETSTIFLGFILVFVGALYLLRLAQSAYGAGLHNSTVSFSLQTTSPGLVLATLGVATVLSTVYDKTTVSLDHGGQVPSGNIEDISEAVKQIAFKEGSVELTAESMKHIDKICLYMRSTGISSIDVDAPVAEKGSVAFLQDLKLRRSQALASLLEQKCSYKFATSFRGTGETPPQVEPAGESDLVIRFNK